MKRKVLQIVLILLAAPFIILKSRSQSFAINERQENLPDLYIVEEGDNLWDISKKYLNDPFKWRLLWEENKYIANPHLIFPGEPISFPGRKKPVPPLPIVKPPAKTKKIKREVKIAPPPILQKIPIASKSLLESAGYIIPVDNPRGRIIASLDEKLIMGKRDLVYIDIGRRSGAAEGDRYTIYTVSKRVIHPITQKKFGYIIKISGILEVKEVQKKISLAVILQSDHEIEVGNKLMTYEDISVSMIAPAAKKEKKDIEGYILATKGERYGLGEGDIVYIDSGINHGVMPGDEFIAYVFGGEETVGHLVDKKEMLPKIVKGELRVISVREKTATALITDSREELGIGEKIEYKN